MPDLTSTTSAGATTMTTITDAADVGSVLDHVTSALTSAVDTIAAAGGVPSWAILATAAAVAVAGATGYRLTRATRTAQAASTTRAGSTTSATVAEESARTIRADRWLRRVETTGTIVAALLATAVSASGMWQFFSDVLGVTGPARVLMFAFLEIALGVSAIRARRRIREVIDLMRAHHDGTWTGPIPSGRSVHQVLVWAVVALSGVMSAADTPQWSGKLLRLAAPAVAAVLWEIGDLAELQAARLRYGITPEPLAWRYSLRRLLVLARLADPTTAGAGPGGLNGVQVLAAADRSRRLTALVRARYRLEATSARAPRALGAWRAWRVRRLTIAAVERAGLGTTDPTAVQHVQHGLALLYTVQTGTAPAAVAHLDPWHTHHPAHHSEAGFLVGRRTAARPDVDPAARQLVEVQLVEEPGSSSGGGPVRVPVGAVGAVADPARGVRPVTVPVAGTDRGRGAARSAEPVPVTPTDDARIVAELVARAVVPTVRQIKAEYRVGGSRAVQLRATVAAELAARPVPGSPADPVGADADPASAPHTYDHTLDEGDDEAERAAEPVAEAVTTAVVVPRLEVVGPRAPGHRA
ncbi:hypothetical protein [Kineosporia sp. R_H_3]|uniref:hypothetical protein n=1 Tax=Kineosporia sp. R_H_3 TaxID=1961848 RepID=UPI000B4C13AC|nr:hypothetical protein [Kineosporia sp. R_H_3]MBI4942490.1 hypothetical protein [Actinomycetota bacterium]